MRTNLQKTNPQDAFAQLVEGCRVGTVNRCVMLSNPNRTTYVAHKPGVDLGHLPIFYMGEASATLETEVVGAAMQSILARQFRLPYPRCGFMRRVSSEHPSLLRGPSQRPVGRFYLVVAEEDDNGSILLFSFARHDNFDHWVKQTAQCVVTSGPDGLMEIAYYPEAIAQCNDAFLKHLHVANEQMFERVLGEIYRLMAHDGSAGYIAGTLSVPGKINTRRHKLNLPNVLRIRVIDFNAVLQNTVTVSTSTGAPKAPHFRRSTWRTLATGRRIFVKSQAIHGGLGSPPPWYEIRE